MLKNLSNFTIIDNEKNLSNFTVIDNKTMYIYSSVFLDASFNDASGPKTWVESRLYAPP
jgi:hypothetical protein